MRSPAARSRCCLPHRRAVAAAGQRELAGVAALLADDLRDEAALAARAVGIRDLIEEARDEHLASLDADDGLQAISVYGRRLPCSSLRCPCHGATRPHAAGARSVARGRAAAPPPPHSATSTTSWRGPCTPSTRLSSMSDVADGPETNVSGRRSRRTSSPSTRHRLGHELDDLRRARRRRRGGRARASARGGPPAGPRGEHDRAGLGDREPCSR